MIRPGAELVRAEAREPHPPPARRPRSRRGPEAVVAAVAGVGFACHGLIFAAVGFALVGMTREWALSPWSTGLPLVVFGAGQLLGSVSAGVLADRFGRKPVLPAAAGLAALGAGGTALAPDFGWLLFWVGLMALGSGGIGPVASSLVSEFAAARRRGQLMAVMHVAWTLGWLASGTLSAMTLGALGWRPVLALAALVAAGVAWSARLLPESPRFLQAAGRLPEAGTPLETVGGAETAFSMGGRQVALAGRGPLAGLGELWRPPLRRRTLMIWSVASAVVVTSQGPALWLPSLFALGGRTPEQAVAAALASSSLMLPMAALSIWLIERPGRRPLVIGSLCLALAGTLALAFGAGPGLVLVGATAMQAGLSMAWPAMLVYATELYPTRLRATGAGSAMAFARALSVGAPLLLAAGVAASPVGQAATQAAFSLLLATAVVATAILGEETAGRSLEELGGEGLAPARPASKQTQTIN